MNSNGFYPWVCYVYENEYSGRKEGICLSYYHFKMQMPIPIKRIGIKVLSCMENLYQLKPILTHTHTVYAIENQDKQI